MTPPLGAMPIAWLGIPTEIWVVMGLTFVVSAILLAVMFVWARSLKR